MSTRPLGWTTLEESDRLVMAGLDSNTADMMYYQTPQDVLDPNNGVSSFGILLNLYPDFNGLKKNMEQFYSGYKGPVPIFFKPCWSLGKLIDIAKRTQYRASWDEMIQWSVLSPMECVVDLIDHLLNEGYLEKNPFVTNAVKVDVLTQSGWQTFDTVKEAAAYIGVSQSCLTVALRKEKPCKGFTVRHHEENL